MPINKKTNLGVLYAVSSGLCYGFVGYFGVSLVNSGMSFSNMLFWRFVVSSLFILAFAMPKFSKTNFFSKSYFIVFVTGVLFYSLSSLVYFYSSRYIGTGLAMVIFFSYPAFVILLNLILNNSKFEKNYITVFAFIIIGMLMLVDLHEISFDLTGITLGILAAILFALYVVLNHNLEVDATLSTFSVCLGCAFTYLVLSIIDGSFFIPVDLYYWQDILPFGIICTGLPILFFLKSTNYISSEKASMLSVLEPVFVVIAGAVLLGEKITIIQIIGTIVILTGAFLTIAFKNKAQINEDHILRRQ